MAESPIPKTVAPRHSGIQVPRFQNDFGLHTTVQANIIFNRWFPRRAQALCHDAAVPTQSVGYSRISRREYTSGVNAIS